MGSEQKNKTRRNKEEEIRAATWKTKREAEKKKEGNKRKCSQKHGKRCDFKLLMQLWLLTRLFTSRAHKKNKKYENAHAAQSNKAGGGEAHTTATRAKEESQESQDQLPTRLSWMRKSMFPPIMSARGSMSPRRNTRNI